MKVCLISEARSYHTQRWAKALSENGCELHLISSQNETIPSVHMHNFPIYAVNPIKKIINNLKIINFIKKLNPDVIHLFGLFSFSSLINMFIIRKLKKVVISVWGSDVLDGDQKANLRKDVIKSYLLNRGDRIIATSEFLAKQTMKYCKAGQSVDTLTWGADLDIFQPLSKKPESNTISIGFAKRLHDFAGPDILLKAFHNAKNKSKKKLVLKIAGDGPMKTYLKKLANQFGLEDSIHWAGWLSSEKELGHFYRNLDIYAMPSIREAFGVSAVEASASGIPVVAFQVGGIPEIVLDGKTGLIVHPNDIEKFGDALVCIADNDKLRNDMGLKSRKRTEELFDWKDSIVNMIKIYEQMNV